MIIIVGLGNPAKKFKNTPHNIGFETINRFQKENNFPNFSFSKKFQAKISEKKINQKKVILLKPQTFMNSSGETVASTINFYKIKPTPESIWVVHDDIDLKMGNLKISNNRGSGGHKGVKSIIDKIKTKNFTRFRIGIKPEKEKVATDKFVLKKLNKDQKKIIKEVIQKTTQALPAAINKGIEKATINYNKQNSSK